MESIETLNERLAEHYGRDANVSLPIFRIVWANDELEKRMVYFDQNGIEFIHPRAMEVKKYPYLADLYVLERLVVVPEIDKFELLQMKLSYEPIWAYCDGDRIPRKPMWEATKFIVDTLYAALGKRSLRKYVDSEKNTTEEGRQERIRGIEEKLFGNETEVGDALAYKEGIVVPGNFKKE